MIFFDRSKIVSLVIFVGYSFPERGPPELNGIRVGGRRHVKTALVEPSDAGRRLSVSRRRCGMDGHILLKGIRKSPFLVTDDEGHLDAARRVVAFSLLVRQRKNPPLSTSRLQQPDAVLMCGACCSTLNDLTHT